MKNNNKLARNAIRARKAQKKRANEQDKPKRSKRWLSRLLALVGCLLLVSALALPCFADYNPTPNPDEGAPGITEGNDGSPNPPSDQADLIRIFLSAKNITESQPLYKLMTYGSYTPQDNPWVFQFATNIATLDVNQFISYDIIPFNAVGDTYCYFQPTGQYYVLNDGWWSVSHTTTGGNKFIYFDFNTYVDGTATRSLRIRFKAIVETGIMESVEYVIDGVGTFNGSQMLCATAVNFDNLVPLSYGVTSNLLVPYYTSLANFNEFVIGAESFYNAGYDEGDTEGREIGLDEGYYLGYTDAYLPAYNKGYDDGEADGYAQGKADGESSNDAWQKGYDAAISQIDSGEFGANLLGDTFNAPIRGLNQFVLVTTPGGVEITLGNVISAVIALVLVLAFLKVYAGG